MRVLVCGEGGHDIGQRDVWDPSKACYRAVDGWLQPLIRRTKGHGIEITVRRRVDFPWLPKDTRDLKPLPEGHGKKAALAKRAAVAGSFDAVIYMADADSNDQDDWELLKANILDGFSRIRVELPSLACVPMSASESWMLADEAAWSAISGRAKISLPRYPERIWGTRNDPAGDHPHRAFTRVCSAANLPDNREVRMRLAEVLDLQRTAQRCPISFASFVQELRAA